jgi:hypothetical protein
VDERLFEFWTYLIPRIPGAVIGMLVIIRVHFALWELDIPRVPSYVIGTSCVISGMAVSAFLVGDPWALINYLIHLAPCGAAIALLWAWRGHAERKKKRIKDAQEIQEIAERERTG